MTAQPPQSFKKRKSPYQNPQSNGSAKLPPSFAPVQGGRTWTISIAIPSSILDHLPTADQRLHTVCRISRALAIFSVDEVVVFDDTPVANRSTITTTNRAAYTGDSDQLHFLTHLLSFLECPPFMRKTLFPLHPNLRHTALLPAIDTPHHPNPKDPWIPYREGVTVESSSSERGTLVNTDLDEPVRVADTIPPNTRVTLQFPHPDSSTANCVDPDAPRTKGGYYWGYSIRQSTCLSNVFTESPFPGGYDVSIGTSERGMPLAQVFPPSRRHAPQFQHLLIVFGGPRGLEYAAANDKNLASMGIKGVKTGELFDHWVNALPTQGTRNVATDEALFIALTAIKGIWDM